MALITWEELSARSKASGRTGWITTHPVEAKKAFNYFIENSRQAKEWKNLPKIVQRRRISALIKWMLSTHEGKFVPSVSGAPRAPKVGWDSFVQKNPTFPEAFETYLKRANVPAVVNMAKKDIPLKEKYESLNRVYRKAARHSFEMGKPIEGMISLEKFAPFTNFTRKTLTTYLEKSKRDLPTKIITRENAQLVQQINRGKEFVAFLNENNIKHFQREGTKGGMHYFANPDAAQRTALDGFLNLKKAPSELDRKTIQRLSRNHPLFKDTSRNLITVLKAGARNFNDTIEGYNNKGLKKFLEKYPRVFKNATMRFNSYTGKISYAPLNDIYKKGYNFDALKKKIYLDIDHNRSVNDYWKSLSESGKISAKNRLLNDVEFAHNLSLKTANYNRTVKESVQRWIENPANVNKTTEIANLEKELTSLGHRYYAAGEFRGAPIDFKPGYRDTVLDAWKKSFEKSTGLKWKGQLKNMAQRNWTRAMKEVTMDTNALRQLGTFLGCPGQFKGLDEGGRVRLQAGGQGLSACVSTKLKQPGAIEKIAALPEEVGGALGKLKNTATTFLGMLSRVGTKAAPLAALAAAGAAIEPLVKQFRNDDPNTYLTDESQMKGMLLATIEGETPKVDEELLKWQYPGMAGSAAAAIPGSSALMKARKAKGFGTPRAALGPVGKFLAGSFSPLGVAATLPISVAAQRKGGTEWGDIATDPFNWMAPAFASTGAEMATRGIKNPMLLKALRMGMKPSTLRMISSRFGIPGLAISAGLWGYDKWKNRSINDED